MQTLFNDKAVMSPATMNLSLCQHLLLLLIVPNRRMFSIGQCVDERPNECDFTREFSSVRGPVPMDCDRRFAGWNIGMMATVSAKPSEIWELLDGIIVY